MNEVFYTFKDDRELLVELFKMVYGLRLEIAGISERISYLQRQIDELGDDF